MALVIDVEVNPNKATPGITRIATGIRGLTDDAKAAGAAMGAAFDDRGRAKDSAGRFTTTATAADKATTAVRGLDEVLAELAGSSAVDAATKRFNDSLTRQAAILEQVRGPAQRYRDDMAAVTALFYKGKINADEYTQQLSRLNTQLQSSTKSNATSNLQTPTAAVAAPTGLSAMLASLTDAKTQATTFQGAIKGLLVDSTGEAGKIFSAFAEGGEAAAGAVAALAHAFISLADEYANLENQARKFVVSGHDVNDVINDQLELSRTLDSSLADTMETYDAIRDGTDDLNLSYEKQIELTKDIGEAIRLSGAGLKEGSGLMTTLSYAFASGAIGGRELKGIMKSMPDIAQLLTEQLGKNRKELVAMANEGKITGDMLKNAFLSAGGTLDEKMESHIVTVGSAWSHLKEQVSVSLGKLAESTGITEALSTVIQGLTGAVQALVSAFETLDEWTAKLGRNAVLTALSYLSGKKGMDEQQAAIKANIKEFTEYSAKMEEARTYDQRFAAGVKASNDLLAMANTLLALHNDLTNQKANDSAAYQKSIYEEKLKIKALDETYRDLMKTQQGFEAGHFKTRVPGASFDTRRDKDPDQILAEINEHKRQLALLETPQLAGAMAMDQTVAKAKEQLAVLADGRARDIISKKAYAAETKKLNDEIRSAYGDAGTDYVKQQLDAIKGPLRDFEGGVAAVNYLLKVHAINAEQAAAQISKLYTAYAGPELAAIGTKIGEAIGGGPQGVAMGIVSVFEAGGRELRKIFAAGKAELEAAKKADEFNPFASTKDTKQGEGTWKDTHGTALLDVLTKVNAPLVEYEKQLTLVSMLENNHALSAEQAATQVEALTKAYEEASGKIVATSTWSEFADGAVAASKQISKSLIHTADAVKDAFTGSLDDVNKQLKDLILTGKADWGKFLDSLANRWTDLALKQVEGSILKMAGHGVGSDGADVVASAKSSAAQSAIAAAADHGTASIAALGGSADLAVYSLEAFTAAVNAASAAAAAQATADAAAAAAAASSGAADLVGGVGAIASTARYGGAPPAGGAPTMAAGAWRPSRMDVGGSGDGARYGTPPAGGAPSSDTMIPGIKIVNQVLDGRKVAIDAVKSREGDRVIMNKIDRLDRRRRPRGAV
jgi:tape measure domain-containing protein